MINMSKVNIDYKGSELWVQSNKFIAKTRTPQHFQKMNLTGLPKVERKVNTDNYISLYRQFGNMLVNKTSPRTGYIMRLALNK